MTKIALEVAAKEVETWLDGKKVSARKREQSQDSIEELTHAIADGVLVLNQTTLEFTQTLNHPIGEKGEAPVPVLKYKPRVKMEVIRVQLANTKATDPIGMALGYLAAITGVSKGILKELDSEDWSVASAIQVFFI